MFKVTTNSKMVALQIDKSMKAKTKGFQKAINNTLRQIHRDVKSNISANDSPEKDRMIEAVDLDLKKGLVGMLKNEAPYAPFIEFGTKSKVRIENPKLAGIAGRFKGIPMDFDELVDRIEKTTGHSKEIATLIAHKYGKVGNTARPFFFPAIFNNEKKLRREFKKALRKK